MEKGKRVLYIGTPIFNYHKQIIREFENYGYVVDFYNDRPSENSLVKGIIKIKRDLLSILIKRYFNHIIDETGTKQYDLIFLVNCKVFTLDMLQTLKGSQKNAEFVLYMWDSLKLYPHTRDCLALFDRVYSFDSEDCNENASIKLLPLFYSKAYEQVGKSQSNVKIEYDIVSVCTAHPIRYKIMSDVFSKLEAQGIRIYSYMFINYLQYLYNRLFVKEFRGAKLSEFRFKPLSEKENVKILKKSDTVFDIQHNKQSGLTMRTIETLGAKKKLITMNSNIKSYDFYKSNNIYVTDEFDIDGIVNFLHNKYEPVDNNIYVKYSLHNWVGTIILDELRVK